MCVCVCVSVSVSVYVCEGTFLCIWWNYIPSKKIYPYKHTVQFSHSVMSNSLQFHGLQHGSPVHQKLLEFTQTHVYWVSDAMQPSYPLSSPSPPALNLSQHQGLSNESVLHIRWPKYWSFSFSISPSNECPGLISFRMDWLDLLAVQGTLRSLLQHRSSMYQLAIAV